MREAAPVAEVKHPTVVGVWEVFWGARTLRPIRQLLSSIVTCRLRRHHHRHRHRHTHHHLGHCHHHHHH